MKLFEYDRKKVRIKTNDNQIFEGVTYDYTPAQDNTPEMASISVANIEFYENEIKSIEIIE